MFRYYFFFPRAYAGSSYKTGMETEFEMKTGIIRRFLNWNKMI